MATNTTRLGLIKPDYVDDVDIADINSNMDDIDSAVGATICTSTTRPGTPFTGQLIFETNTDKFLVWTGSVWEESVGGAEALNDLTDVTITTPAANQVLAYSGSGWVNQALATAQFPAGTILQVVQTVKTNTFSMSSTTFANVTGMGATITPRSASSKILVMVDMRIGQDTPTDAYFQIKLTGGNSAAYVGNAAGSRIQSISTYKTVGTSGGQFNYVRSNFDTNAIYLDAPATTSPVTYQPQVRAGVGTLYVNRSADDSDNSTFARTASSITLMEVAG